MLYGTTSWGGAASVPEGYTGNGTIYKIEPDGSNYQILHDFSNEDKRNSEDLMIGNDGSIYGVTRVGGTFNHGQVYKIGKDGSDFTILFEFDDTNSNTGSSPSSGLVEDSEGYLYGTVSNHAGEYNGAIYKVKNNGTEFSILHSFDGIDGDDPEDKLRLGSNNTLYGNTLNGGVFSEGVAFSIKTDGSNFTKLYDFNNADGENPKGQLIINELPTGSIEDVELAEDSDPFTVDLYDAFQDTETPDEFLEFEIIENSNSAIFSSIDILSGDIIFSLEDNQFGSSTITLRCTDGIGDFVDTEFSIIVYPIFDVPTVTKTTATYGMLSSTGLVISKNENDGNEVTNFKITEIVNGILYKNDGNSIINNGDFISVEKGLSGLNFLPKAVGELNFTIQASSLAEDSGLGGTLASAQITVSKSPLEVTAIDKTITYGDDFDFEVTITGFVFEENEEDLSGTLAFAEIGSTVVGEYLKSIIPRGLSSDNYEIYSFSADLTIKKKELLIIAQNENITYGDVLPEFSVTYSGFAFDESKNNLVGVLAFNEIASTVVGDYLGAIVPSGLTANNYEINFTPADLMISKKELLIVTDDQTRKFDQDNSAFTMSFDGLVNDEKEIDINVLPHISSPATATSDVGIYEILLEGGEDDNYELSLEIGTLSITKADASITFSNLEQKADGTEKQPEIVTNPADLNYTVTFNVSSDVPTAAGDYEVTVSIDEQNYEGIATETFTISQILAIEIGQDNFVKLYPNPANESISIEGIQLNSSIKMYNLLGKLILIKNVNSDDKIDVSQFKSGRYFISVYNKSTRLIKQLSFIKTQ
ncbi:MAG: putative repeat protein (TIGR03803 family) [Marinoscillum sp.]|jgi:uncharacterized repeat protein (TIGR03803 family)